MYARSKELALGGEEHRRGGRASSMSTRSLPTTVNVLVLRMGDAWLVGFAKRAPHNPVSSLVGLFSWLAGRVKSFYALFPYIEYWETDIAGLQGSAG